MDTQTPTTPPAPTVGPRSRLPWIVAGLAVVVAAVAVGWQTLLSASEPERAAVEQKALTVDGIIGLGLGGFTGTGPGCEGAGGFDDVAIGTDVTVTDASGTVVAVGAIESSAARYDFKVGTQPLGCDLHFRLTGVPAGKKFYGVEVGRRGVVRYDEAALARSIKLTLD